jgi:hypothetical protein
MVSPGVKADTSLLNGLAGHHRNSDRHLHQVFLALARANEHLFELDCVRRILR